MSLTLAQLQARGLVIVAKYDELNLAQRGRTRTMDELAARLADSTPC